VQQRQNKLKTELTTNEFIFTFHIASLLSIRPIVELRIVLLFPAKALYLYVRWIIHSKMFSTEEYPENQSVMSQKSNLISTDNDEESTTSGSSMVDAESFLESYEEMLQHQKEEVSVTKRHLEPLLYMLEAKRSFLQPVPSKDIPQATFAREFTYQELRQALNEVSQDPALRFVASDIQWNMVLEVLSQTYGDADMNERISWAEIVMCYRVCIIGMQTLEQAPQQDEIRARIRQRSVQMIEAFRPSSTHTAKHVSSVKSTNTRVPGWMQLADPIFLAGALILGLLTLLPILGAMTSPLSTGTGYSFPRIPGWVVRGAEDLLIPGPIFSPHASDALKIPGPTLSPLPTDAQTIEQHPSVSPVGGYKAVPWSVQLSSREPSMPAKMKRRLAPRSLPAVSISRDKKTAAPSKDVASPPREKRTLKTVLAAVAVAGGTAAAGLLAPMATAAVVSLGTAFSTLFPIGATVVISTLLAHAIRDWVASLSNKNEQSFAAA
jgi:hypothetical protein